MKIYQAFCLGHPAQEKGYDWFVALQTLSTAYQWKHIFPEDEILLYGDVPFLEVVRSIQERYGVKLPYSHLNDVDFEVFQGTEYTGARWYTVSQMTEPSIFLDPDILVFPEFISCLEFYRRWMNSGHVFLGGYEQGYYRPDIDEDIRKKLGLETDVNGNMNSGFMLVAGNYGPDLGKYEIDLQRTSVRLGRDTERMRTLEVIDGTGPKYWVRTQKIPYYSIDIPKLLHMTGLTLDSYVEHNRLGGSLPKSERIRYLAAHALHTVRTQTGTTYRKYCNLFSRDKVGSVEVNGPEVDDLVSGTQRFLC